MGDLPFKHHLKNIFMSFWFRSVDHGLFISPFSLIICLLVRSVTPVHFTCNKMYGRKTRRQGRPGLLPRVGDCKIRRDVEIGELP